MHCVQKHVEHHNKIKGKSIAVGRAQEDLSLCKTDFHFYRAHLIEKWLKPLTAYQGPLPADIIFLTAQNFSIFKDRFDRLGGFDERLRDIVFLQCYFLMEESSKFAASKNMFSVIGGEIRKDALTAFLRNGRISA